MEFHIGDLIQIREGEHAWIMEILGENKAKHDELFYGCVQYVTTCKGYEKYRNTIHSSTSIYLSDNPKKLFCNHLK